MSLIAFHSEKYDIYIADELSNLGWYIGRLQNPRGIHLVVSQIHADGAAENFIADLQLVLKSLSSSEIKNKIFKATDVLQMLLERQGIIVLKKQSWGKLNLIKD